MAPLVNQRVVIDGLSSKPELNGTKGVAVSFDDAKGRYNVRMEGSGQFMALKPINLLADRSGGGGIPGMGDSMPGMGGGMPGMGGMGGGGLAALLAQLMQQFNSGGGGIRPQLPFGLTPQQAGMGAMALMFALRYAGLGMMQALMLGGAGLGAAKVAQSGQGAELLGRAGTALGRVTGRPVTNLQAGVVLAALAFFGLRSLGVFGGASLGGVGGDGGAASSGYAAYTKGYQDAKANNPFDPISDAGSGGYGDGGGGGSGFGIGKMINLAMAGSMLYRLGGQPWSPANFAANLKQQNPLNLIMMFSMLSSLF